MIYIGDAPGVTQDIRRSLILYGSPNFHINLISTTTNDIFVLISYWPRSHTKLQIKDQIQ